MGLLSQSLFHELGIDVPTPMHKFYDNLEAILIANNLVFHEY
jgi:hypothetical protein